MRLLANIAPANESAAAGPVAARAFTIFAAPLEPTRAGALRATVRTWLESDGWVGVVVVDEADHRSVYVMAGMEGFVLALAPAVRAALTPAGHRLVARSLRSRRRRLDAAVGRLDSDARRHLARSLWELTASLGEAGEHAWALGWPAPSGPG